MFNLNEEEILEKVYEEAQDKITEYGVNYILAALGFRIDKYHSKIEYADNNYRVFEREFIKDEDIQQIISNTRKKVNYYVKKEILKTLESDLLQHMIKTVQEEVLRNCKLVLEQHIQTKVYRHLKQNLEEKLIEDVCSNPTIKNIMIKKL
jgi:hypothetical protein